jgi:hypothetical protein
MATLSILEGRRAFCNAKTGCAFLGNGRSKLNPQAAALAVLMGKYLDALSRLDAFAGR